MIRFKTGYFLIFILLLFIEIFIAVYIQDDFIRPYVGDLLVVMLLYAFVKSFFALPVKPVAIAVLLFAFTVEILQYFNLVVLLGLKDSKFANIIIGNYFAWGDLLAYTLGILFVLILERNRLKKHLIISTDEQFHTFI